MIVNLKIIDSVKNPVTTKPDIYHYPAIYRDAYKDWKNILKIRSFPPLSGTIKIALKPSSIGSKL